MNNNELKRNKILIICTTVFLLGIFVFSGYKIISYLKDNYDNKKIQARIKNNYIKVIESDEQDIKYEIDFKSLKKENSDTVAYLKVNGTNIDYVVVRGIDNNYYLKRNFEKNYNVSGWIYADYRNKFDGTDKNIVIFGHNTQDGSMFGTLKKTLYSSWQKNKDNFKILLTTEQGTYYYQVFSTYEIKSEEYYIKTQFYNDDDFKEYVNVVKSRSNHNYKVKVDSSDSVLTLSSCTPNGKKRVVLHAKLINKE